MNRWHTQRDGCALTLSRRLPVRFDVFAETTLPHANPVRLAHQIRQDIWRALQRVRGFSPVVRICTRAEDLHVRAGGRIDGPVSPDANQRIARLLEDPAHRARWIRHAGEGVR